MKDNLLEVGDRLYFKGGNRPFFAGAVDRVTKTCAFIGKNKIHRKYNGHARDFGSTWCLELLYYLMTPEIEKEIKEWKEKENAGAVIINYFKNNLHDAVYKMPIEKIRRIAEILEEK